VAKEGREQMREGRRTDEAQGTPPSSGAGRGCA
jgi:hypothetical protein